MGLSAAALMLSAVNADARSFKRGLSENSFGLEDELTIFKPGVSWFYNWGNTPNSGIASYPSEETIEFIPMCWNANYNVANIKAYCQSHPETKYLLGFNEPNFKAQANMTPAVAAEKWTAVKALADELGLELVGPAVNYSPDGPDNEPFKWYAEFVKLVGLDAFDYIAIHNYSGGVGGMKAMIDKFYSLYGKRIWVTEFCLNGDKGNNANNTVESQISSMVQQLEYLEKEDKVFRYSWFKAKGSITSGPKFGLIVPKLGYGERELSEAGYVYTYMSDFDANVYHSVEEIVPAKEYIRSNGISLGKSADAGNKGVIEISSFISGSYADYQFNVPSAGKYTLSLKVSGQGEPVRFDPKIGAYAVDADGNQTGVLCEPKQFALSGDNAVYEIVEFEMELPAGKQTIRLQDANPYAPSGIRISSLSFSDKLGGISEVSSYSDDVLSCKVIGDKLHLNTEGKCEIYDINGRLLVNAFAESGVVSVAGLQRGVYVVRVEGAGSAKFCR